MTLPRARIERETPTLLQGRLIQNHVTGILQRITPNLTDLNSRQGLNLSLTETPAVNAANARSPTLFILIAVFVSYRPRFSSAGGVF